MSPPPPPYDVVASRVRAIMNSIANHDETLSRQGAIFEAISAALGARVDGGQAVGSTTSAGSAAGPSDSAPGGASGVVSPSHLPRRACACCNSFSFSLFLPLCFCCFRLFCLRVPLGLSVDVNRAVRPHRATSWRESGEQEDGQRTSGNALDRIKRSQSIVECSTHVATSRLQSTKKQEGRHTTNRIFEQMLVCFLFGGTLHVHAF